MKFLLPCLLLLIMTGCSLPRGEQQNFSIAQDRAQLYSARLTYRGEQKFSGLLALRSREQALYYNLLDATGIKLLSGSIQDGRSEVTGGILRKSSLGPVFGEALERIWLLEPKQKPCSDNGFLRFCMETEHDSIHKDVRFGPLPYWSVRVRDGSSSMEMNILYLQPWLDLQLELQAKSQNPY